MFIGAHASDDSGLLVGIAARAGLTARESSQTVAGMKIVRDRVGLAVFQGCVLVPTMGALHDGHAALIRQACEFADRWASHGGAQGFSARPPVVVSIFVNPTQFTVGSDFERYPRTLEADAAMCEDAGADVVFAPGESIVYPPGEDLPTPVLPGAAVGKGLEDAHRPGHFEGVCQVVRRLFELTRPVAAIFGEKDWQQLQVVRSMAAADPSAIIRSVAIVPGPTVRDEDGLAMSSRNRFLSPESRRKAVAISQALCDAAACATPGEAEAAMRARLDGAGARVDYATVRVGESLDTLDPGGHRSSLTSSARALIAARFGVGEREVRLLDNAPWPG